MKSSGAYAAKIILALAAIAFAAFLTASSARAQVAQPSDPLRLTTSPLPVALKTTPGVPVSTELRVKNDGGKSERITVDVMKFSAGKESGELLLEERGPEDEFLDWVSFSEKKFLVSPGEWKTINVTFSPPSSAALGYYYAITFMRDIPTPSLEERQTAIVGGTATLVLLEVSVPNARRQAQIEDFSTKKIYEFLPVEFLIKVKNTGNIHVAPRGNIFIDLGGRHDLGIIEVNPIKGNILPDSVRIFTAAWEDGFPHYAPKLENGSAVLTAEGKSVRTLVWDFSQLKKLRWGRFTAKLLMVYEQDGKDIPLEATTTFWVVPWRIIGGIVIIAFVLGAGVFVTARALLRLGRKR